MGKKEIRERVLKERGIQSVRKEKNKRSKLEKVMTTYVPDKDKTLLMKYLEEKYKVKIEEVLTSGSLSVVSKALGGEVDVTTISKWIKKLKLRYSPDNLPSCENCPHYNAVCDAGVCHVLMSQEEYNLVVLKRKEILDG